MDQDLTACDAEGEVTHDTVLLVERLTDALRGGRTPANQVLVEADRWLAANGGR